MPTIKEESGPAEGAFVDYDEEQHRTWAVVSARLAPLHARHACASYLGGREHLGISSARIPQLPTLSLALQRATGYVVRPIAGLEEARKFLISLGRGVMLSTTYIRDGANPEYTPQPDIVHEVIGHVPMLLDPDVRALLALFGAAAETAGTNQMIMLDRLYWFSVEYGLVTEGGEAKAYGAGLLSSFGEMENAFAGAARHRAFDAGEAASAGYDHTHMQPILFVTPSIAEACTMIESFLASSPYRLA